MVWMDVEVSYGQWLLDLQERWSLRWAAFICAVRGSHAPVPEWGEGMFCDRCSKRLGDIE